MISVHVLGFYWTLCVGRISDDDEEPEASSIQEPATDVNDLTSETEILEGDDSSSPLGFRRTERGCYRAEEHDNRASLM
jgi:hypothetical protein